MPQGIGGAQASTPEGLTPAEFAALFRLQPEEAARYLQARDTLVATYDWRDLWHDEHAVQFTVSRLARVDLLSAIQEGIERSVNGDLSRRDFMRDIEGLLAGSGWWGRKTVMDPATGELVNTTFDPLRLKLIYDTNTRMAYSAGRWERFQRTQSTHPYLRYITKGDERVREDHQRWANLTLPIGHAFWATHYPPNGWRCRCRVIAVSQAEYDRLKAAGRIVTETPPIETRAWLNKRTGETVYVPVGIDPGFDYNVGMAAMRARNLAAVTRDKLAGAPAPLRRAALAAVEVKPVADDFRQAIRLALDSIPEGVRAEVLVAGYEVHIGPTLLDISPDLAGTPPRGHTPSITWANLDGVTRRQERVIAIAEYALDAVTGERIPTGTDRASRVLRHEYGHAWDLARGLSASSEFITAYEADAAALRGWLDRTDVLSMDAIRQLSYLLQPGLAGRQEAFAELFAELTGGGAGELIDALEAFPATAHIVRQFLAAT